MIFKNINELKGHIEISLFREKIDIYIKTVKAVCKKFSLSYVEDFIEQTERIIDMGIISDSCQLQELKKMLTVSVYREFNLSISTELKYSDVISPFLINLKSKRRKILQEKEKNRKSFTLVDLFCGAGGLSLGFKQEGFKIVFANDIDPLSIETYKFNHPEIPSNKIVNEDIKSITDNIEQFINEKVDVVIGGPPCQGFSSANKHHRVIDDPRNELYKYFLRIVEKLGPKIVVMENVKGMLKVADQVVEDFENIRMVSGKYVYSYKVHYELLNSSEFSVAQNRERLIYIAIRNDVSEKHHLYPAEIFDKIHENNKKNCVYNLSSALQGLRPLIAPHKKNVGEIDSEEGGRKIDSNPLSGNENDYLSLINENRTIPLVYNHKARYCSELNYEIYKRMNQGDDATDPKIADIMPYAHRNDKFKDKYFRLYADRPCRTITAHLRSDCHSHIHPTEDRAITPREAARIQSFPDDYLFMGPYLKTYIQIGNAVPVLMARGIAKVVKSCLGEM